MPGRKYMLVQLIVLASKPSRFGHSDVNHALAIVDLNVPYVPRLAKSDPARLNLESQIAAHRQWSGRFDPEHPLHLVDLKPMLQLAKKHNLHAPIEICDALLRGNYGVFHGHLFDLPLEGHPQVQFYEGNAMSCVISEYPVAILDCDHYLVEHLHLYTTNMILDVDRKQFICLHGVDPPDSPAANGFSVNVWRDGDSKPVEEVQLLEFLQAILNYKSRAKSARSAISDANSVA